MKRAAAGMGTQPARVIGCPGGAVKEGRKGKAGRRGQVTQGLVGQAKQLRLYPGRNAERELDWTGHDEFALETMWRVRLGMTRVVSRPWPRSTRLLPLPLP